MKGVPGLDPKTPEPEHYDDEIDAEMAREIQERANVVLNEDDWIIVDGPGW